MGIVNNKEPAMPTAQQIRAACEPLHARGDMEPEDVYQEVAWSFGIEVEELYEILEAQEA
jgi:NTP pyrophosphatase (non-canonical NTP hydrolase)